MDPKTEMKDLLSWEAEPPWDITSLFLSVSCLCAPGQWYPKGKAPEGRDDITSKVIPSLAQQGPLCPTLPKAHTALVLRRAPDQIGGWGSQEPCNTENLLS